jgi:hypothetical protein
MAAQCKCSVNTIHRDVMAVRDEWHRRAAGTWGEIVEQERFTLDADEARLRVELARYAADAPQWVKLRLEIMDRIMKCMERRARLLGLDAPTRQQLSGPDGGPVRLEAQVSNDDRIDIKAILVDPEALDLVDRLLEISERSRAALPAAPGDLRVAGDAPGAATPAGAEPETA